MVLYSLPFDKADRYGFVFVKHVHIQYPFVSGIGLGQAR